MGSDKCHFNVLLIVRDKVTRQCPHTTTFEEKGEPKRNRTEVQTDALPLGQTSSRFIVSHPKDFCSVCLEFDSGEISGRSQSLAPNGHPFMRKQARSCLIWFSTANALPLHHRPPPPPFPSPRNPPSPAPTHLPKLTCLNYPLFARCYQGLVTKFRS